MCGGDGGDAGGGDGGGDFGGNPADADYGGYAGGPGDYGGADADIGGQAQAEAEIASNLSLADLGASQDLGLPSTDPLGASTAIGEALANEETGLGVGEFQQDIYGPQLEFGFDIGKAGKGMLAGLGAGNLPGGVVGGLTSGLLGGIGIDYGWSNQIVDDSGNVIGGPGGTDIASIYGDTALGDPHFGFGPNSGLAGGGGFAAEGMNEGDIIPRESGEFRGGGGGSDVGDALAGEYFGGGGAAGVAPVTGFGEGFDEGTFLSPLKGVRGKKRQVIGGLAIPGQQADEAGKFTKSLF
jgi:hypothetical protein